MAIKRPENAFVVLQVIGVMLLLDQVVLLLPELVPAHPGTPFWRFGAFGMIIGRATSFLFADALILFSAYRLSQQGFLRTAGYVHFAMAVGLLAALGMFGLDTLQVRKLIRPENRFAMQLGALRAGGMATVLVAFLGWVGWRLLRDVTRKLAAARESGFLISAEAGVETSRPS